MTGSQVYSATGAGDINGGASATTASLAGDLRFGGVTSRTTAHDVADGTQDSLHLRALAAGAFHLYGIILALGKQFEAFVTGKAAKFVYRHNRPPENLALL
jgi:hypothetical protein